MLYKHTLPLLCAIHIGYAVDSGLDKHYSFLFIYLQINLSELFEKKLYLRVLDLLK